MDDDGCLHHIIALYQMQVLRSELKIANILKIADRGAKSNKNC